MEPLFYAYSILLKATLVSNYLEYYLLELREANTKCIRIERLIRGGFINGIGYFPKLGDETI